LIVNLKFVLPIPLKVNLCLTLASLTSWVILPIAYRKFTKTLVVNGVVTRHPLECNHESCVFGFMTTKLTHDMPHQKV
jgi:hypothetical protein